MCLWPRAACRCSTSTSRARQGRSLASRPPAGLMLEQSDVQYFTYLYIRVADYALRWVGRRLPVFVMTSVAIMCTVCCIICRSARFYELFSVCVCHTVG